MLQGLSVQVLHGDEGAPVLFADVVDRANVVVVKRARGTRFTLESDIRSRIRRKIPGQKLQGYRSPEPGIERLIDDAHPSPALFLNNLVVGNRLTDQGGDAAFVAQLILL